MAMELLHGRASEGLDAPSAFFAGTIDPKRYRVSESLADQADDFLADLFAGRKSRAEISEALTTSSLSMAIFQSINTQLLSTYEELKPVWRDYTAVTSVPDFRPTRLLDRWTSGLGLPRVPELTEYPAGKEPKGKVYWINVAKYGQRDEISWEAQVNRTDIDEVESMPLRYARAAAECETINALSNLLLVDPAKKTATGINTAFFKASNGNAPDNRPLTAENLDAVLGELAERKPGNDRIVVPPEFVVVIPRSLEQQMRRIMALREIRITNGAVEQVHDNYLASVSFVVEPMLGVINTGANAATTWFVVPKPDSRQPATFAAFLRGYEAPDMRYRADAGQALGGGGITAIQGGFVSDGIETRVRHVVGAQTGDGTFTYASTGA